MSLIAVVMSVGAGAKADLLSADGATRYAAAASDQLFRKNQGPHRIDLLRVYGLASYLNNGEVDPHREATSRMQGGDRGDVHRTTCCMYVWVVVAFCDGIRR